MSSVPEGFADLEFTLGDRMAKALKRSGRTARETASHFDVSPNTISNWLNGHTTPRTSDVRQWALWTGVPLEFLTTGQISAGSGPDGPGVPVTTRFTQPATVSDISERATSWQRQTPHEAPVRRPA